MKIRVFCFFMVGDLLCLVIWAFVQSSCCLQVPYSEQLLEKHCLFSCRRLFLLGFFRCHGWFFFRLDGFVCSFCLVVLVFLLSLFVSLSLFLLLFLVGMRLFVGLIVIVFHWRFVERKWIVEVTLESLFLIRVVIFVILFLLLSFIFDFYSWSILGFHWLNLCFHWNNHQSQWTVHEH